MAAKVPGGLEIQPMCTMPGVRLRDPRTGRTFTVRFLARHYGIDGVFLLTEDPCMPPEYVWYPLGLVEGWERVDTFGVDTRKLICHS